MPRRKKDECEAWDGVRPPQRNAANARERSRMRVLSKAFCRLKTTLPWVPADTKLSKLDTLRLATTYIAHLRQALLEDEEGCGSRQPMPSCNGAPLSWPFGFGKVSKTESTHCDVTSTQKLYYPDQGGYADPGREYPESSESYEEDYFPFESE